MVTGRKKRIGICALLCVLGVIAVCVWRNNSNGRVQGESSRDLDSHALEASLESPGILAVPKSAVDSMRLAATPARGSTDPRVLRLTGRLMYDPNKLVHVNTRFGGEVIRIGDDPGADRMLRVGDHVDKGQLLAIVWSKEIGEKKSDLVDALSQMALHELMYKALKALEKTGAAPQRSINEMERLFESDMIQVERYRRTLRSWKVDESELAEVEQEAKKFHARVKLPAEDEELLPPSRVDHTWAEIDIKSPLSGTILEKNLTIGDIVNTDDDLFKVADLSRLIVMANIFEDDIPALIALPNEERVWQIRLMTNPQSPVVTGSIDLIGNVIDPNQHTAVVQGEIDNSQGNLRVGQFVEAMITLPGHNEQIEIPLGGLIDRGARQFVLVALNDDLTRIQRQEVVVERRTPAAAFVRRDGPEAIQAGDKILVRGVLELSGILDKLSPTETADSSSNSAGK